MKKFILSLFFCLAAAHSSYATTRLLPPERLDIKELNTEQKNKLQNIQYSETQSMPNQYKGKLKYTEGKEEVHLKDVRMFFGIGGRYTFSRNVTLDAQDTQPTPHYYNKKNTFNFDDNFNFYASLGVYWRNGIRIEFEYSQLTMTSTDFGKNFARYSGPDTAGKGYIFNQYLQETGTITNYYNQQLTYLYSTLTNNGIPKIDLEVKTYMINFIFEKTTAQSKLRPYIGFGFGLVNSDIKTLVSDGTATAFGGQILVGLSYSFSNDALAVYLGYRGIFSQDLEQTFTRVTDVRGYQGDYFDGSTYWNPVMSQSKERYKFQTNNIDLGIRFFF